MAIEINLDDCVFNVNVKPEAVTLVVSHRYTKHRIYIEEKHYNFNLTEMKARGLDMMAQLLRVESEK